VIDRAEKKLQCQQLGTKEYELVEVEKMGKWKE